ncbi:glycosyltransferase family 4 protein [Sphingobacterium sp. UT-1RO-CII-1]|uniref:glycosyltransferase family 4 protein n=1 Tax=Sphingobacterium sp. UT-1RO-CII-1 TaxID=2995225 RepID=UPI00227C6283|nr:glycosyltransferase family 4 protein [Sphingobacterium sp. UT-1RO-CII-1]MCY4780798.1 glycosyltransferase family 4 protein [Sphingobacterium sp. UT-1RO-CII-1]
MGPILVVRDLVSYLTKYCPESEVYIYYLDEIKNPIPVSCKTFWIKDPKSLNVLFESDIIHSHGIRPDFYVFRNRKKFRGKCFSTIHSSFFEEYKVLYNSLVGYLVELLWTKLLQRHDSVIVLTEVMKQHYVGKIDVNKLVVINNGRNIQYKEIEERDQLVFDKLRNKYKILGVACVLTKRKGIHQVVNILPFIADFAFVIIGDGPEMENLKSLSINLGVQDRCIFLGSRLEANRYNVLFDFYIFPSYMEGLPLSLLEAAAMSKTIICSAIPVHKEIFTEDEVSFFQLDDSDSLLRAIKIANVRCKELKANVFSKYRTHYTAQIMGRSYYELYSKLIR